MSNTRTAKKTEADLADMQLDASPDQDVRLPADKRAEVKEGRVVAKLEGKEFGVAEDLNTFALMEWAASDANTSMAATYRLMKSLVADDEWAAFSAHATESNPDAEKLVLFINAAVEAVTGRPTKGPGGS